MEISVARKRLEEMRADLDRTVSVLAGEHHLVRGGGAEAGDAGANLTDADRNAASMQAALAQRAEVLAALSRIDDGSYGRCVDCAGPVPEPRLEARPATARCVPCQSKRDRRRRLWAGAAVFAVPSNSNHSARRCGLCNAYSRQPLGFNSNHSAGAPCFPRCPPQGGYGGRRPPVPGGAGGSSPRGRWSSSPRV
jgi:DnaK suppressor protein